MNISEQLLKNHQAHPTSAKPFPKANPISDSRNYNQPNWVLGWEKIHPNLT